MLRQVNSWSYSDHNCWSPQISNVWTSVHMADFLSKIWVNLCHILLKSGEIFFADNSVPSCQKCMLVRVYVTSIKLRENIFPHIFEQCHKSRPSPSPNTPAIMISDFLIDFEPFIFLNIHMWCFNIFINIMYFSAEYEWNWCRPCSKSNVPNVKQNEKILKWVYDP